MYLRPLPARARACASVTGKRYSLLLIFGYEHRQAG